MKKFRFKYIGIDPGASGGISVINTRGVIKAYKCPSSSDEMAALFEVITGNTSPNNINVNDSNKVKELKLNILNLKKTDLENKVQYLLQNSEIKDRKESYYQKLSAYFSSKAKKRLAIKRKAGIHYLDKKVDE